MRKILLLLILPLLHLQVYSQGLNDLFYSQDLNDLRKNANNGNPSAEIKLGLNEFDKGNYMEAEKWYRKAASQNNAIAQYALAGMYRYFYYYHLDTTIYSQSDYYRKAADLYQKAAAQGYAPAEATLGELYFYGDNSLGIKENPEEAKRLYLSAAQKGYARAMRLLSESRLCDKTESKRWLEKAAKNGDCIAQTNIGNSFLDFKVKLHTRSKFLGGVFYNDIVFFDNPNVNYDSAIYWFHQSSSNGCYSGKGRLGLMFYKGFGVQKNIDSAYIYFLLAGEGRYYEDRMCFDASEFPPLFVWNDIPNKTPNAVQTIKIEIYSETKVKDCILKINNNVIKDYKEIKLVDTYKTGLYTKKYHYTITKDIVLDNGVNTISLFVKNKAGKTRTEARSIVYAINGLPQITSNSSLQKPIVRIISPSNGGQYKDGVLDLSIYSTPNATLYVEINGGKAIKILPSQTQKGSKITEGQLFKINNLPNIPGEKLNLTIFSISEQGIESEHQKLTLQCVGEVLKPKLILFAVGVGDYTSGDLTKLRYAAKDARDFTNTIENCNLSDYTGLKKHIYINSDATRNNINKGLREVLNEANQGDVVMFYFSGHGVQDGDLTYFMTINASSKDPDLEGVNFAVLKNNMRKLTEQKVKVVAFMDACHAGAMVGAKGAAPKLTELNVQDVIEFYSSTTGEESAEDEKLQNGVFTAGLISGLNGAAANADGYITVNTLRTYLSDYVRNHNSRQTPVFKGVDAGDITLFHKK